MKFQMMSYREKPEDDPERNLGGNSNSKWHPEGNPEENKS